MKLDQSPVDYQQEDDFDEDDNSMSGERFQLIGIKRRQSIKPQEKDIEVYSTIKNFERLPNTSIKLAGNNAQFSEDDEEERYDISYDIAKSD